MCTIFATCRWIQLLHLLLARARSMQVFHQSDFMNEYSPQTYSILMPAPDPCGPPQEGLTGKHWVLTATQPFKCSACRQSIASGARRHSEYNIKPRKLHKECFDEYCDDCYSTITFNEAPTPPNTATDIAPSPLRAISVRVHRLVNVATNAFSNLLGN